MKRILLAICGLLLAFSASSACSPPPIAEIRTGASADGLWAYWWCPATATDPKHLTWRGIPTAAITPELAQGLRSYSLGTNPGFATTPMVVTDLDPTLAGIRVSMLTAALLDPDRPGAPVVAPVYTVPRNGLLPDRPSYKVTLGKRSLSSSTRIAYGSPCDCVAIKIVEGFSTYCQVAPTLVALCTKPSP